MSFTYKKKDKLKHKKHIDFLFKEGKSIKEFPLCLIYTPLVFEDESQLKTGVSVSKRLHKKAVDRNRIKRLMREAFRLNKPKYFNKSETSYAFMILYISKDKPNFKLINEKTILLFKNFNIIQKRVALNHENNTD